MHLPLPGLSIRPVLSDDSPLPATEALPAYACRSSRNGQYHLLHVAPIERPRLDWIVA